MYSTRVGQDVALKRIENLIANNHDSEALITAVFTIEEIMHRTLNQLVISSGFTSKASKVLLSEIRGISAIKKVWPCFDPKGNALSDIIGKSNWQVISKALSIRNNLIHGSAFYNVAECKKAARQLLTVIEEADVIFNTRYRYSCWGILSTRKTSMLHLDPLVETNRAGSYFRQESEEKVSEAVNLFDF